MTKNHVLPSQCSEPGVLGVVPAAGWRCLVPWLSSTTSSLTRLLLVHAATGSPVPVRQAFTQQALAQVEQQVHWLMQGGLGPLLYQAIRPQEDSVPGRWCDILLAADLTARVRQATLTEVAVAVIDACRDVGVEPVLLKGISVGEQLYPKAYFRPMSDIDVLVPQAKLELVTELLTSKDFGYQLLPFFEHAESHHDVPLRHPQHGVVVELHKALFARYSPFSRCDLFQPEAVLARAVPSSFHGRPVRRLPADLQLAYMAASWFSDLTVGSVDPTFQATLFDAVYLLRKFSPELRWQALRSQPGDELLQGCLYALLSYLPRFGLSGIPSDFVAELAVSQRVVGPLQRRLIHWMLERYVVAARFWTMPFPPPVPGRYSWRYQWHKRVGADRKLALPQSL